MTHNFLLGMNGMKAKTNLDKRPVVLGICSECYDNILEGEEHVKIRDGIGMHVDCCSHNNCNGNYEDVWCMDCGADYNNGRLW